MKYPIYSFVGTVRELSEQREKKFPQVPNLIAHLWKMGAKIESIEKQRLPSDKEVSACCYWPINDFKRCTKCGEAQ